MLTRLPDPKPYQWLDDYTRTMKSVDWYGFRYFGATYGNFWASRPCKWFPHRWLDLGHRGNDPRIVSRCQRCGSQIYSTVPGPVRGAW